MPPKNWCKLALSITIAELVGIIGSIFIGSSIGSWYAMLAKPLLAPTDWIFAVAWMILYFLMGIALYLAWSRNWKIVNQFSGRLAWKSRKPWNPWSRRFWMGGWQAQNVIAVFAVQWILNVLWPYLFFGLQTPGWAFFEIAALWCSIIYVIINFTAFQKLAAWLMLPMLAWVTFAAYLNYFIWIWN